MLKLVGQRLSFPLALSQSHEHVRGRVALLGDEAQTMHPLAGMGLNLALTQSALLSNLLIADCKAGHDLG
jgi:2-polyprenyl-6-methoxyphenol hydroxylase-like FAD-dependent oxidoreductase